MSSTLIEKILRFDTSLATKRFRQAYLVLAKHVFFFVLVLGTRTTTKKKIEMNSNSNTRVPYYIKIKTHVS